ncbi:MAG: glutamate--cysteine ligase [Bacteriovoracaceae bacterium]|nr:glutamate--cysteine ligase [Bacteriovoracaceae bacterium]
MQIVTKDQLEEFVCKNWEMLNRQIDEWQSEFTQPIYSSVDIRESQTKYAPVDHNLYPAGFNNICQKDLKAASQLFKDGLLKLCPGAGRVALIPESHTKNRWYLENVFYLAQSLEGAGFSVDIISPDKNLFAEGPTLQLKTQSEFDLTIHQVKVENGFFQRVDGNTNIYDVIVLNHDQSIPLDVDWKNFQTPVAPTPFAGWTRRHKNIHFKYYREAAKQFCELYEIDPNLIQAKFRSVDGVDFETKEGIDKLANEVDALLKELPEGSSVFAKASQGTYGMGISVFSSRDEVLNMNRKTRNKMDIGKNNIKFTSVLVQEGVETIIKVEDAPAEITTYLVAGKAMGGFMRYNPQRGTNANLNSQGMLYNKFCFSDICQDTDTHIKEAVYALIGRLSVLAASRELHELQEQGRL